MALTYDFDIVMDRSAQNAQTGEPAQFVARFRNPETAKAFGKAPPKVRQLLCAVGFDVGHSDSGILAGYYPDADQEARDILHANLTRQIASITLETDQADFDFDDFVHALERARPLSDRAQTIQLGEKLGNLRKFTRYGSWAVLVFVFCYFLVTRISPMVIL